MKTAWKISVQLLSANAVIFICIAAGSLLPSFWGDTGGRDFIPQTFNAGILILLVSFMIRSRFKWPGLHMILYLIPSQFIILFCMSYYSGYSLYQLFSSFDYFYDFLQWLLLFDIFIAVPWIIGVLTGTLLLRIKKQIENYD